MVISRVLELCLKSADIVPLNESEDRRESLRVLFGSLLNSCIPGNVPDMILILYAHPYPQYSRACKALLDAIRNLPDTEVRSLYDLYPDFDIDIAAEQAALSRADLVIWLHPLHWYSVPGLLKHWFDVVLLRGWAYGEDGTALHGKQCLWVTTTGGDAQAYSAEGIHQLPFADFVAPLVQTARYCGMAWQEPFILHASHLISDQELQGRAGDLHARLMRSMATRNKETS